MAKMCIDSDAGALQWIYEGKYADWGPDRLTDAA
jgi:hypothetical protein